MAHGANAEPDLEGSVCGFPREPLAFWQFRMAAGRSDASRVKPIRNIQQLSFATRDGRVLGGYKLRAKNPQGYLLVAQGNAMLADQIIGLLDRVVPPGDIEEMAKIVQARGGLVLKFPEFAHPLMDIDPAIRRQRFQAVADFLTR